MSLDKGKRRAETPGCRHRIHLNNAGAALMPQPVIDAHIGHLELESGIGGYEAAAERHEPLENAYAVAASFFNAQPDEDGFYPYEGLAKAICTPPHMVEAVTQEGRDMVKWLDGRVGKDAHSTSKN